MNFDSRRDGHCGKVCPAHTCQILGLLICLILLSGLAAFADDPELLRKDPTTQPTIQTQPATQPAVPDLQTLLTTPQQEMWAISQRFTADQGNLNRFYTVPFSPIREARFRLFYTDWLAALDHLNTDRWSQDGRTERDKLRDVLHGELKKLDDASSATSSALDLLPFAPSIITLGEARLAMNKIDPQKSAAATHALRKQIELSQKALTENPYLHGDVDKELARRSADAANKLRDSLRAWFTFYNDYDPMFTWWTSQSYKEADQALVAYANFLRDKLPELAQKTHTPDESKTVHSVVSTIIGHGKIEDVPDLQELVPLHPSEMAGVIQAYFARGNRGGSVASFAAGNRGPGARSEQFYRDWLAALEKLDFDSFSRDAQIDYILLRNRIEADLRRVQLRSTSPATQVVKDESGISGRPIGNDGLAVELAAEMIPYSPQQLIDIAEKEYVWCEAEIKKASREMGCGDDWKLAVEKVKTMYVPPGQQPYLIRDLAREASAYVQKNDMVTVPQVADESWRMEMMTPQRQLVNPFFTGGETISVSYPTSTMSYDSKLESMRGNNIPFSRATVFHELIPGHHLQGFMNARYRAYRRPFNTPFWIEGWSLYWEMILYDRGFPNTPENRVGALFWRMHRCARIVFSLGFHMGKMTPQQCIDYLVEKVGHERQNAAAEVRRSFNGSYTPLYQAAYMLGGLQIRELRKELVQPGKMSERQFHDALLRQNSIPIAMMRADLTGQKLSREFNPDWAFYGTIEQHP